jgi:hypothetical protein
LSGDGATALIGGAGDDEKTGAAWVFATPSPPPEPTTGSPAVTGALPATATSPAATTPAKQGVAGVKAARGRVALVSATVIVQRNGWARVRLKCIATTICRGALKLTVRIKGRKRARTISVGVARFALSPRRTSIVKLELDAAGRSRLRTAHGRLGARLVILVSSPGPNGRQTHAVRLVLRAGRVHRRARL